MGNHVKAEHQKMNYPQLFVIALLVFWHTPVPCAGKTYHIYSTSQLRALRGLYRAWSGTPDPATNLAGWTSDPGAYPCSQEYSAKFRRPNWRGVECLTYINCFRDFKLDAWNCTTLITRLSLNNASLVGNLPNDIRNLSTLTTLELTGNPKLTGRLPSEAMLESNNLYNLDLHENAFYGEIPDFQYLLNLNVGGNWFNGSPNESFPLAAARAKGYLQTLNLSRNSFEGVIPERAFVNMTKLHQLDLSNNRFNGTPPDLTMCKNLQILDLSNNSFTGALPALTTLHSLRTLILSGNKFTGSALNSWNSSELGSLHELYLDNNLLNGTLDIAKLYAQGLFTTKSGNSSGPLTVLSLTNNNISYVRYNATNIQDIATVIRLQLGNPYCASPDADDGTRCFCTQVCFLKDAMNNDKRKVVTIAVATSVSSLLVLMVVVAALLYRNRRYKRYLQLQVQQRFEEFEVKPTIFPYNQLRTATRDFHVDMKLGQGAFGAVYKGVLPNGNEVAVKQLFATTNQGIDEFLNEVVLLTGMKHRNLVNLKGCCIREQQRLLVYEYVDNYDIDKNLLVDLNKASLSWPMRWKMCLGVARGLHYLHALAHPKIIHRDIKASNILLTNNYEAKIADFGLALLFPDEESYVMTKHVAGTKGYLAPKYASYGQLSDKVDVFSFGVLCLEIVSGRRNIDDTLPFNKMYLSKWDWELHRRGELIDLVDPRMSLQNEERFEVIRLIKIALLCIQNEAEQRPSMERLVSMLQGDSQTEAVTLNPGTEEQYMESPRLFVGKNGLDTVKEESESSFLNSSRHGGKPSSEDDVSTGAVLELSEISVR